MTLRAATAADLPALAAMLRAEGLDYAHMDIWTQPTAVLEDGGTVVGGFTVDTVDGYTHLRHFVVGREHRSPARARALGRGLERVVRAAGGSRLLLHGRTATLNRFIRYWFRGATPHARAEDGTMTYLVRVED